MKTIKFLTLLVLTYTSSVFANICLEVNLPPSDIYEFNSKIKIFTFDGHKLSANLITPKKVPGPYPTIIFPNSWLADEHEFLNQALLLVKKGYQVLGYSTRGWGCSEGEVNVVGPKDMKDLSKVVDWLIANTNIDKDNIGLSGISYGGGMTLMGLAMEPRIKTGFAMSAWGSLTMALNYQNTPRKFWGSLLVYSGIFSANLEQEIKDKFSDLMNNKNIDEVMKWAETRSPINHIKKINDANKPVFLSNNYGDNLFTPNNFIEYYHKLKTPKILDLNQGTHATGEITGLFTVSNYTFKRLHKWFDYWLKGEKNNGLQFNTVNIQTDLQHKRETISENGYNNLNKEKFYFSPTGYNVGRLLNQPYFGNARVQRIYSGKDTAATTGIPLFSALIDGNFKIPTYAYLPTINRFHGVKFSGNKLEENLKIRGIPKLKVNINSNFKNPQIVAYLYDVNFLGQAKLITHGVSTAFKSFGEIEMSLTATAYDIPKGNRLMLVLDTEDKLYTGKNKKEYSIDFEYQPFQSFLEVPIL